MIGARRPPVQPRPPGAPGAEWDLVLAWARSPARQMAVDQALAESVWDGLRPPTLRLYGWRAPGLTIGRLQRPEALPGPAVRRLTGGRAVFHQHEVTLALALPAGHPLIGPTVAATYRNVIAPVRAGLEALGLAPDPPARRPAPRRDGRFACFSAPTGLEPEIGGHKVVALAQRIGPRGLLAQASIPLSPPTAFGAAPAEAMPGLTRFRPGLTWQAVAEAVAAGFGAALRVRLAPASLTPAERRRAASLAAGAYSPEGAP
jgi:lipoate-protein ligase A